MPGLGIPFTVDLSFGHTFASAPIAAGVDVVRVSTVLGHAKVQHDPRHLRGAVQRTRSARHGRRHRRGLRPGWRVAPLNPD